MLSILGFIVQNVYSQKFYFSLSPGYNFNFKPLSSWYPEWYNYSSDGTSEKYEQKHHTLGKGFTVSSAIGHWFSEHIATELEFLYKFEDKTKTKYQSPDLSLNATLSTMMYSIMPTFVLASGEENIKVYTKVAPMISFSKLKQDSRTEDTLGLELKTIEFYGAASLGIMTKVGIKYKTTEKLSLFAEVGMMNLSYSPKRAKIIKDTYNGVDILPYLPTSQKEVEFVDAYTYDSNNVDSNKPAQSLKQSHSFSSVGINVGIVYTIK